MSERAWARRKVRRAAARLLPLLLPLPAVGAGCVGPSGVGDRFPGSDGWIDESGLHAIGFGEVSFVARDGNHLEARTYRSTGFAEAVGPVWFIMHGADRDVDRYIGLAAPVAERHDALAIAIHFSEEDYPEGEDYTLGIYAWDLTGGSVLDGPWRAPEDMLYAEVEHVFDRVLASLGGSQPGYYIFGHSAGAQFAHRLLTFLPEHRALVAVAANAGWYTLPVADDPRVHTMPYGLIDGPVDPSELTGLFGTSLVVLLSEHDTTTAATDDLVRGTYAAEAQGKNRLERGHHYYRVGEEQAAARQVELAWRLDIVPGAGHDAAEVIQTAGFLTFFAGEQACAPSPADAAASVVITEILADPPDGAAGDANGDGVRDPDQDELVEISNRGALPVCLTGWMLGDAASRRRHVFGPGPALEPGGVAVVFGGGVPTGRFGGARVERAAHGLSLQNAGDVLTLRRPKGDIVAQASWGDCAEASCAADHWPEELGVASSLARAPHGEGAGTRSAPGRWELHRTTTGHLFSPGVVTPSAEAPPEPRAGPPEPRARPPEPSP